MGDERRNCTVYHYEDCLGPCHVLNIALACYEWSTEGSKMYPRDIRGYEYLENENADER